MAAYSRWGRAAKAVVIVLARSVYAELCGSQLSCAGGVSAGTGTAPRPLRRSGGGQSLPLQVSPLMTRRTVARFDKPPSASPRRIKTGVSTGQSTGSGALFCSSDSFAPYYLQTAQTPAHLQLPGKLGLGYGEGCFNLLWRHLNLDLSISIYIRYKKIPCLGFKGVGAPTISLDMAD